MANNPRIGPAGVLIGAVMLTCVIVAGLIIFRPSRPKSEAAPRLNTPIERASNIKCVSQLRKINTAIQMYGAENGKYPDRLQDLTVLSASDLICPVSNRPYSYDPAAGRASCPGHD